MCTKAGLHRGQPPKTEPTLSLPVGAKLAELTNAVSWTDAQLRDLFADTNLLPTALQPFEMPLGIALPPGTHPGYGPLLQRPLVRDGGTAVIALPHGLLTALSRFVLDAAHDQNVLKPLAEAFHSRTVAAASRCLDLMGLPELADEGTSQPSAPGIAEQFRWLDTDKLLHVIVVTDDLSTYTQADPFGEGAFPSGAVLDGCFRAGLERARTRKSPPREVLGLLVTCGVSRHAMIGMDGGSDDQQVLLLHLDELDALSTLEPNNPLYLWHFSRARERLRHTTEITAWSLADELFFYRKKDSSFYLADDQSPNHVSFEPNAGDTLSLEAYQKFDPHAIMAIRGGFLECVRVYPDSSIPVYCPRWPSATEPAQCVEVGGGAIWVFTQLPGGEPSSLAHTMALRLVDSLAFWLGRMAAEPFVRAAAVSHARVEVCVRDPEQWAYPSADPSGDVVDPGIAVSITDDGFIRVEFPPEAMSLIGGSRGPEERVLLLPACRALARLAGCQESDADTSLIAAMPSAVHRKLVAVSSHDSVAVRPRSLPPRHLVAPAAEQEVLDDVKSYLEAASVAVGPVPAAGRTTLLNKIVEHLFAALVNEIAALSPNGLLEWLVAQNEAIVDALSMSLHLEPFNLACFAEDAGPAREFADRLVELYKADQACRFLIEYVGACPPAGQGPMSFATYDRLLGLSSKVVFFGMLSDDIRYGTDDPALARLRSGRLGISESRRQAARDQYLNAFGSGQRARLLRESQGTEPPWLRVKREQAVVAINAAAEAEFGFSLAQHADVMDMAVGLSIEQASAVTRIESDEFASAIVRTLKVDPAKAKQWLDGLSISSRPSFFDVPRPAEKPDVYPWRYNRRWSYVRRPFLIVAGVVVYGSSHVDRAGVYLRNLCFSGRLKAASRPMQQAIGKAAESNGARFNHAIADLFRAQPHLVVRDRIEKFDGLSLASASGTLGDVDVLVADPRARRLRAYECKDLSVSRTPSEVHNELADFSGSDKSIVAKHTRRVEWLREHLTSVLKELGVPSKGKWDVRGIIVVDEELVSPFLVDLPMSVMSIADVEAMLRSAGTLT